MVKINIHVKPGKKQNKLEIIEGVYFVELKERAEKGKANLALIKFLAKHFNIPTSDITIVSGFASRKKIVEVRK